MKISQIIDKINEKHLFVPAFQREYVWKKPDAKNLVSSLINDYPTGTMLTWETTNPPELKGEYAYESSKGAVKLILDGQQRITTLYMLMTGEIPPYYSEKEILVDIRNLYVNAETLQLEYYKQTIMSSDPCWINITDIFKGNVRARDITDELEEKNDGQRLPKERENKIQDNIETIKAIKDREFKEQIVPVNASVKEAIDIFYIVNSSGVNLTNAELALAQISGYWPTAREEFKLKLDELKERGWVLNLDFIVFCLLATVHGNAKKLEKLHTPDNKEHLQRAWDKLKNQVLDYTFNLMQSQAYIDHTDEINSVYALLPIIKYVYQKPNHKLSEEEIKKAVKWFYYSQIRRRYISSLLEKLDKDLAIVENSSSPFDELLNLIAEERNLEITPQEFRGRGIRYPLFSLMCWYFKSVGAVCLGTGLQLRKNMGKKYDLEKDHIFAWSLLRDSEYFDMNDRYHYDLAQEITNRAILTTIENRNKSAKDAAVYLASVKEKHPNALRLQCIPEDEELWKIENYEKFIEKRREMLSEKLNEFLENISVTEQNIKSTVDVQRIIDSGEDRFIEYKSSMRWNIRENKADKEIEKMILKTVSGFTNAEGGTLLIGVSDDGEVLGLQDDYNTFKEANKDHFELHLKNIINSEIGNAFGASNVTITFPTIDELEICMVEIAPSNQPIYLEVRDKNGNKSKKFYVRSGNRSQELEIDQAAEFIKSRFA